MSKHSFPSELGFTSTNVGTHLGFLPLLEKSLLSFLVLLLLSRKVAFPSDLLDCLLVDPLQIHSCGRRDDVSSVHSSKGNAIHFERACDEEDALRKVFEEDDALAAETASEEDKDGAGFEAGAGPGGSYRFADLVIECMLDGDRSRIQFLAPD